MHELHLCADIVDLFASWWRSSAGRFPTCPRTQQQALWRTDFYSRGPLTDSLQRRNLCQKHLRNWHFATASSRWTRRSWVVEFPDRCRKDQSVTEKELGEEQQPKSRRQHEDAWQQVFHFVYIFHLLPLPVVFDFIDLLIFQKISTIFCLERIRMCPFLILALVSYVSNGTLTGHHWGHGAHLQ